MAFWFWTAAVAAFLAAMAAAMLSPVRIRVRYARSGQFDRLNVVVRALFGLVCMRVSVPAIAVRSWSVIYKQSKKGTATKPSDGSFRLTGRSLRRYRDAYRALEGSTRGFRQWLFRTLRKVECTRWRMDLTVGTGDAALTAVAAGLLWTLLGCSAAATGRLLRLKTHPHGEVRPVFAGIEFTAVCEADLSVRLGTMLLAMIQLLTRVVNPIRAYRAWRSWTSEPEPA